MKFQVRKLISMDVYRDGGSLSLTFKDNEGTRHELIFLVDKIASDANDEHTIYKSAVIESFIKSEYVSPVTGVVSPKTEIEKQDISWQLAGDLLVKMAAHVKNFQSDYLWVYQSMLAVSGSENRAVKFS